LKFPKNQEIFAVHGMRTCTNGGIFIVRGDFWWNFRSISQKTPKLSRSDL